MQLTLKDSSIVEVLADLQSAIDNGLNNRRIMLQTYRLKYKVDRRSRLVKFTIYQSMTNSYPIVGSISKVDNNNYTVSASIPRLRLITDCIGTAIFLIMAIDIVRSDYIFWIFIFAVIALQVWEYKHTNANITKIFYKLKDDCSHSFAAKNQYCDFENFLDTGPVRWTYLKPPPPFIRKLKMKAIDFVAVICILVGLTCFFYSLPIVVFLIKNGTLGKYESIRLLISTAIFLLCAFFVTMSLLSGNKRKQS